MEKEVIGKLEESLLKNLANVTMDNNSGIVNFLDEAIANKSILKTISLEEELSKLRQKIVSNLRKIDAETNAKNYNTKLNEIQTQTLFGNEENLLKALEILEQYNQKEKELEILLPEVYKSLVEFQLLLSSNLKMDIILLHTESGKSTYFKKYSEEMKEEDGLSFLNISASEVKIKNDQLKSLNLKSLESFKKKLGKSSANTKIDDIVLLIRKAIKEQVIKNKKKMYEALQKEEETYEEILSRLSGNQAKAPKKGGLLLWAIREKKSNMMVWDGQKIPNRGPLEETRQYFLLQIHKKEIYNLFQGNSTAVGRVDNNGTVQKKEAKEDILIHNYIRSEHGLESVDNRSGLIIDDHLLKTKSLLEAVAAELGIGTEKEFVSIGSKTGQANFTSHTQYLTLLKDFQKMRSKKLTKRRVKALFQKFFSTKHPITKPLAQVDKEIKKAAIQAAEQTKTLTK